MHINVTTFRKNLFGAMERAKQGQEVIVTHKGDRYRLTAEDRPSIFDRITPLDMYVEGSSEADEERYKVEREQNWLKKWADLEL